MAVLKGYLQPTPLEEKRDVFISNRFKGEDGKPLPFTIKKIDQATANALLKQCQRQAKVGGQLQVTTDNSRYSNLLIVECVVTPDLRQKEVCDAYGVVDPAEVPGRMLSIGEYARLSDAIMELNDLDTPEKIEEEAKN